MSVKKRIAILGSTGSIGIQSLEVIAAFPDHFEVSVLTANRNAELLVEQALKFQPNCVVIADETKYLEVKDALWPAGIKTYAGSKALEEVVAMDEIDLVLTALVGFSGLLPTLSAISAGKSIALANKETLVVAGQMVTDLARKKGVNIYPVDSEHSAIFQCLAGEFDNPIEKIFLTASGGPFRGMKKNQLEKITKSDALKHPNWQMGEKITIDSATLMNKGFEVIEARWLFGLTESQIEVVVHPQSIIHSIIQFCDGSMKAQMGLPDMKLPIQYAFSYPKRLPSNYPRFDFNEFPNLSFEKPDSETFGNLQLAYDAMRRGSVIPCVLNAVNEVSVRAFLDNKISFTRITEINTQIVSEFPDYSGMLDVDCLLNTDLEARRLAREEII